MFSQGEKTKKRVCVAHAVELDDDIGDHDDDDDVDDGGGGGNIFMGVEGQDQDHTSGGETQPCISHEMLLATSSTVALCTQISL